MCCGWACSGGRAGEDLVLCGLLWVFVVLCSCLKRYNENFVVFLLV